MKTMFTRCAVLAMGAVFVTGCVGTLESPHQGSYNGTDPIGDQGGYDPRGDIDLWGVRYSPSQVEFYMKPAQLGNPANDANWTQNLSQIQWFVETNNDFGEDFTVTAFLWSDGSYEVWAASSQGDDTCTGTGAYNAAQEIVSTLDPVACFGGRGPIRVRAELIYDSPREFVFDEAPAFPEWSGWITPSAS